MMGSMMGSSLVICILQDFDPLLHLAYQQRQRRPAFPRSLQSRSVTLAVMIKKETNHEK